MYIYLYAHIMNSKLVKIHRPNHRVHVIHVYNVITERRFLISSSVESNILSYCRAIHHCADVGYTCMYVCILCIFYVSTL